MPASDPELGPIGFAIRREEGPVGQRVARFAARTHGVVTASELRRLGMHRSRITRWIAAGHLHAVYRGVYAVGTAALTREARWLAAVRACGPLALLSHLNAGVLWGMLVVDPVLIHVIATRGRKPRDGIRVHRPVRVAAADRAERLGIPVTSPERTWLDLAGMFGERTLRRALSEGERAGILDPIVLSGRLQSRRGVPGAAQARSILESYRPAAGVHFRSNLERTFWDAWLDRGLPAPEVNAHVCGIEVDMLWRHRRLAVELDGSAYHSTHEDRRRDERNAETLRAAGFNVLRYSDTEIAADLDQVVEAVLAAYRELGAICSE